MKQFQISKDEDPITNLLEEIESNEYALFLVFKSKSVYSLHNIKLDACETIDGPDFNKKEQLTLDNLLEFFCSDEYLDKDNEWFCKKCNKKVKVKKKFSLFFVPRLLIICLNRFAQDSFKGNYRKNGELIDFPLENLDMIYVVLIKNILNMIYLVLVNILEVLGVGTIQLFVKIMMGIGMIIMILHVPFHLLVMLFHQVHMFYFIENKIGEYLN